MTRRSRLRAMCSLLALVWLAVACAPAPARPASQAAAPAATPVSQAAAPTAQPAPQAAAPAAQPASDDRAVADFYRGKTLRLIVGNPPGGGYDTYARAIARYIGKYLPGNPTVIVENMPGAASLVAANFVYNAAPKDGTVVLHFQGTLVQQQLFGAKGVEFDGTKFQYLGAPVGDTSILHVTRRSGITTFDQLLGPNAKEVVLAGIAPGAQTDDSPKLVREILGARIKLVSGYQGTAPIRLAVDAGEADGFFNAWESTKITNSADIESGNWIVLLQLTDKPHRDLPNVPTAWDLARTDEQRQLLRYGVFIPSQFTRPFAVAPGVPPERVRALREAFAKTLEDGEFLADVEKGRLILEPSTGEQLQRLIEEYLTMPEDVKAKLQNILVVS